MTLAEIETAVATLQAQAHAMRAAESSRRAIVAWRKRENFRTANGITCTDWRFCDAATAQPDGLMRGYGWEPLFLKDEG